ncbi:uroporphyrinogen-III synthase [Pantoea sp. Aalb]|uniref:uroporphyrinogen-III synthase n=1 Tax=Pantoea sp. Aalb TaxID=2576762 RepID=UPI0013248BC6|nr:uroporphyrinogen-III synthase [Pantoea sp. Aalb]MXP67645.1 uroporphyrinogen-III synthase [Pantoea sp. Aalb]
MSILITRPEPAASELVLRLKNIGKFAWALPLIQFTPGRELHYLPQRLQTLHHGDLVFLLSQQVVYFANPTLQNSIISWPKFLDYYAIGRSTALAMKNVTNLEVNYPHKRESSEELIRLNRLKKINGKNALILRGNTGRELLAETLVMRGVKVKYCECYQRHKKYYDGKIEGRRWRNIGITTLVVTSGEMLEQLFVMFTPIDRLQWLLRCRLLVVNERLAIQAAKLGWRNIDVAHGADNNSLIYALQ